MTEIITPSKPITDGQIDKAVEVYRAMLNKHRSELGSEEAQRVLCCDDYVGEQIGVLRKRVEAVSNLIVCRVKVNRSRTPQEAIDATGRVKYVNREVVDSMPRGEGEEKEVVFFKPRPEAYNKNGAISDDALEKEYELVGLTPIDPYSLSAVNEDDPSFADDCPNATHWKDANGKWCYAAFNRWHGKRSVFVNRNGNDWDDGWRFAGARK